MPHHLIQKPKNLIVNTGVELRLQIPLMEKIFQKASLIKMLSIGKSSYNSIVVYLIILDRKIYYFKKSISTAISLSCGRLCRKNKRVIIVNYANWETKGLTLR